MRSLFFAIISIFCVSVCASGTEILGLQNGLVSIAFDARGNLVKLKNEKSGRDYAGGQGIWRAVYQQGSILERAVSSEEVPVKVSKISDTELKLSYGGDFPVEVSCTIVGDEVRFDAEIGNVSKDKILREFQFPSIKNVKIAKPNRLIMCSHGGMQYRDVENFIKGGATQYKSPDNVAVERFGKYPREVSMNFYVLEDGDNSLYVACLDPTFDLTVHLFRYRRDGVKFVYPDLAMSKYPFLKAGEKLKLPTFVVSPYVGDWHIGGKKYRKWADTWYKKLPTVKSVAESCGWQRMILRHQHGQLLFPYSDLPKIAQAGFECGIDSILMFGWWREGMDSGYPHYSPEIGQGGDSVLRENIAKVQAAGGRVMVYFNGQLIDTSTEFYRSRGRDLCVKAPSGIPHFEVYPFGGDGTSLLVLGNKSFTTACHAVPAWFDILKSFVDRAFAIGADGVFLDQMGGGNIQICFDSSHPHKVPCTDLMRYKADELRAVRDYIKSKNPSFSFGVERATDCTSQYVDYIHACGFDYRIAGKEKSGRPFMASVPVFRYVFPETRLSDRSIRDDTDIERRVNTALLWGVMSDIEIYRCRATIDAAPHYKKYLAQADALRKRFSDFLLAGTFRHTDLAKCSNERLDYSVFTNARGDAVVLVANGSSDSENADVSIDGFTFGESASLGAVGVEKSADSARVSLKRNGLALLVFKKK